MALQNLKNKSMKRPSLAFLLGTAVSGLNSTTSLPCQCISNSYQKSTFTSTAPQSSLQYDDKPQQPPLIERPKISPELESEIRYSCALLYYSVENEEVKQYSHHEEQPVTLDKQTEEAKAGIQITTDCISSRALSDKDSQEGKHDSGIGLDTQQSNNQTAAGQCMSRFYQQNSGNIGGRHSSRSTAPGSPDRGSMADDGEEVFLRPDSTTPFVRRVPSFYWPKSDSRFEYKLDIPGIPDTSEESENDLAAVEGISEYIIKQNHRPDDILNRQKSPIGMGAIDEDKENNEGAVIIDKNGVVHVMSAAEESQRQLDLQRAVMEKMRTGAIGPSTQVHCDGLPSYEAPQLPQPCHSKYEKESRALPKFLQPLEQKRPQDAHGVSTVFSQPRRAKSGLFRKLSGLNIRRRKTVAPGNRDCGF